MDESTKMDPARPRVYVADEEMGAAEACSSQFGVGSLADSARVSGGGREEGLDCFCSSLLSGEVKGGRKGAGNWRWIRAEVTFP